MIDYFYHSRLIANLIGDMKRLPPHTLKHYLSRPEAELDLHGFTRLEALLEVQSFLEKAHQQVWQRVKIITGRGLNSHNGQPILKEAVMVWLEEHRYRFEIAKGRDGGPGSLIVVLT